MSDARDRQDTEQHFVFLLLSTSPNSRYSVEMIWRYGDAVYFVQFVTVLHRLTDDIYACSQQLIIMHIHNYEHLYILEVTNSHFYVHV